MKIIYDRCIRDGKHHQHDNAFIVYYHNTLARLEDEKAMNLIHRQPQFINQTQINHHYM